MKKSTSTLLIFVPPLFLLCFLHLENGSLKAGWLDTKGLA
jgi:hypothetical protein